jgi:hypothetical protein
MNFFNFTLDRQRLCNLSSLHARILNFQKFEFWAKLPERPAQIAGENLLPTNIYRHSVSQLKTQTPPTKIQFPTDNFPAWAPVMHVGLFHAYLTNICHS